MYDRQLYSSSHDQTHLPSLVPQLQYAVEVDMYCLKPLAAAGTVRVLVVDTSSSIPLLSAVVQMPLSELDDFAQ